MQKLITFIGSAFLWSSLSFALEPLKGNIEQGHKKSELCASCHMADGNSTVGQYPKLSGQSESYTVKQLTEFRKADQGNRSNPIMAAMSQALTDQDIADLAAYFASQPVTIGQADPNLVALGEKLFKGGNSKSGVPACASCHQIQGLGNMAGSIPRLSGQLAEYIELELHHYQKDQRKTDPNGMMRDIAKKLTDEEIKAVSSYVSGLH